MSAETGSVFRPTDCRNSQLNCVDSSCVDMLSQSFNILFRLPSCFSHLYYRNKVSIVKVSVARRSWMESGYH